MPSDASPIPSTAWRSSSESKAWTVPVRTFTAEIISAQSTISGLRGSRSPSHPVSGAASM